MIHGIETPYDLGNFIARSVLINHDDVESEHSRHQEIHQAFMNILMKGDATNEDIQAVLNMLTSDEIQRGRLHP